MVNLRHEELGDAERVLDDLAATGVAIEAVDGRLRLSPPSAVDAALMARVAAHKPAILSLLATQPDPTTLWRQAVELLAERLNLPPDVLEAVRSARVRWVPASQFKEQ
jgi:NADPH-dependent ferric siderophore reductase